ncbi:MAG: superoxide dismutase [Candidatus Micrarchaeota archaeon]|nr:superoxide dismutase [Candidatus Micrarchaeota archaeon]MDE1847610.1 superoxide dismutase [Candidatus Micrarchaeota archaeon]MDE1863813.1 superoxide dismutase [Candidatus Micrarchaeota archaeon]
MAKFELPKLPYAYNALEPFISEKIMQLHHDKHHQAYLDNLNKAIDIHPEWGEKSIEEILRTYDKAPDDIKGMLRNHGGGYYNHSLFWEMMSPAKGQSPLQSTAKMIDAQFGDFNTFKKQFSEGATKLFGSGWQWLVLDGTKLAFQSTQNQESPLTSGKIPILGIDVWEHAYYLDYQNRRAEYIDKWWNVVNWEYVEKKLSM